MNKTIYGIALALVLGTTSALASPGDDGCIGNCPQSGGGGGPTNVESTNENNNSNENTNTSESTATSNSDAAAYSGSYSDSDAYASGGDANVRTHVGVKVGGATSGSESYAEGGAGGESFSYAEGGTGGDSSSVSEVGDTTATSGDSVSEAYSGGNSQSLGLSIRGDTVTYEDSASRAASVYSQVCQNGGSAQAKAGGFAIQNQDVVCEHLKVAAVMREAYMWELKYGSANCVATMEGPEMDNGTQYSDVCFNEKAMEYYKGYHEHMTEALQAMEAYEEVGLLDKMAGALIRPMALIGALIWLI